MADRSFTSEHVERTQEILDVFDKAFGSLITKDPIAFQMVKEVEEHELQ
jgi:hypothetical protein